MTPAFDTYWSFRTPSSYLPTRRLVGIADHHEEQVKILKQGVKAWNK